MFGDGIFTQDGERWRHSRDILRPQLVHRHYEDLEVFAEAVDDLLDALPPTGGVVDLQPLFFQFTLDVTTSFLFGESFKSLKSASDADEHAFASAFDMAQLYIAKRFRLPSIYWLIGGKQFSEACRQIHQFADQIIDRNLAHDRSPERTEKGNRYAFLRSVAQASPDRASLRGQVINILAAGRDTTACMLSWTL
jgi:cytochrome P450